MQVFSHGRRFARAASAAIRAEAAEGGEAAEVVGIPRSTLFNWDRLRWQGRLEP